MMALDFADALSHGMIVSELAVMVSKELGMDDGFIKKIALAGMLHDIGKLKLSDKLHLERSRAMVVEKMKYVRMHASLSRDIMRSEGIEEDIVEMVYHHHENNDGSGYPSKMSKEEIPMTSQIVLIVDAYYALIEPRTYRAELTPLQAVEIIKHDAGKKWNSALVQEFLTLVDIDDERKNTYTNNKISTGF